MRVTKEMIISAQTRELRAITEEVRQNPGESLDSILSRRPPYIGWIDENGKRLTGKQAGGGMGIMCKDNAKGNHASY